MDPDGLATVLILVCLAGHAAAYVLLLLRKKKAGLALFGFSWAANAALFAVNWVAGGDPPFGNMYHVMTFLPLCVPPLYLLLAVRNGLDWLDAYFAFTSALAFVGALSMKREVVWHMMPALRSPWFVPHVASYVLSYALAAVGFAVAVAGFFGRRRSLLDDAARHEDAAYEIIRLALPFMTFGLFLGAIWAEEAWGTYWSWDPKETWALITWTLYVIYIHCYGVPPLRRYAGAAHVLAFLALLSTFFLVNLWPKLASFLHGYA